MRPLAFAILSMLLIGMSFTTTAQAEPKRTWSVEFGPNWRITNEGSYFGDSTPYAAWLNDFFDLGPLYEFNVFANYQFSTTDGFDTSAWGLGVGVQTSRQWYATGGISYNWINGNISSKISLSGVGGYVGTGYDLQKNERKNGGFYIEAKYVFLPSTSDVNNNGLNTGIGYRF
jgi:hypothetical protein